MSTRRTFLTAAGLPALARAAAGEVRVVVDSGGGGEYQTIQRAIDHVLDNPPPSVGSVVFQIRPGIYKERLKVPQDRPRLVFQGSGAEKTVITSSMSAAAAGGTFFSSIVEVNGTGFEARDVTFENTFGVGSQAVAISVHSDRAVFQRCRFLGWQDTLYAAWGRQYYRDCHIEGHVDFIFGNAAAVFDHCRIHSRDSGYIAAHSRTAADQPTGYVFRQCELTGASGAQVYLGRPWRAYSRVVFLDCKMGAHIRPEGWDNWRNAGNEKTAWFAERGSTGPGANPKARAGWARPLDAQAAAAFAPGVFLRGGDGWNPNSLY